MHITQSKLLMQKWIGSCLIKQFPPLPTAKLRSLNSKCSLLCISIKSRQSETNILMEIELVTIGGKESNLGNGK